MDVMRLPLGILTGMGFIGAGAILHRGKAVIGVTTAATLWLATLMGFFASLHRKPCCPVRRQGSTLDPQP
jgi:uncharacterized membrane protein YhiD involved in acid resistance